MAALLVFVVELIFRGSWEQTVLFFQQPFRPGWTTVLLFALLLVFLDALLGRAHHALLLVAPLALLSGTFYSVERLAPAFRAISHFNPFFYIISGFRYGFLGVADSPIATGSAVILGLDVVLGLLCYWLLRRGWKLKN